MLTALLALSMVSGSLDYPWFGGVSREKLLTPDIVAIVEARAPSSRSTRQLVDLTNAPGDPIAVRSTSVKALDGKGVEPGNELLLVTPLVGSPVQPLAKDRIQINVRQPYLVFAFKAGRDRVVIPSGLSPLSPNDEMRRPSVWIVGKVQEEEVGTVMLFPVKKKTLPASPTESDVLIALIESLNPRDDDSYRRLCTFLQYAGPKLKSRPVEWFPSVQVSVAAPDEVTKALQAAAKLATPYQRSKIWELLLTWRLEGSKSEYVRSLQALANDPKPYAEDSGDNLIAAFDTYQTLERLPPVSRAEWMRIVSQGKNTAIVAFFLRQYGPELGKPAQAQLAKRLLDPSLRVRIAVAYALSLYNNDSDHRPAEFYTEEEAAPHIRYWIDFYKVGGS